jgi:hypothetical protein
MSLASLFASTLLSFWLWQLPPPPYGLPNGAKPGSDQTAADGTRTITYESQGNQVEIEIDLSGATTETTTAPNGQQTTRQYETVFNPNGTRTETRDEGSGRTERRTVDAAGRRTVTESITEVPRRDDPTTIDREIRTTTYGPNGRRTSVTTTKEEDVLSGDGARMVRKRKSTTETFDPEGNRTSRTREELEVIDFEDGVGAVYGGTRTTQRRNAEGKIDTTREILDENQQWVPEPVEPPPATDPGPEPEEPITSEGPARRAIYVALSPGIIHIALPDSVGYQWGLRGGVEFPCGGPCAIAAGLGFQHSVASANAHELRTQAELMPGARLLDDRLFVFGHLAIGHVANVSSFELMGTTNRFTQHGVAFSPGAGVSYAVWRELYVGGRFGADLQWFPSSSGTFAAHHLALEAFLGYRFGF